MRFGVQLFGICPEWAGDLEGFLRKAAAAGCRQIEPCVVFGDLGIEIPAFLKPEDLRAVKPLCDTFDITISSAHAFSRDLTAYMDEMASLSEDVGISQYVIKCPQTYTREAYEDFAAMATNLGLALKARGISLLLHNEDGDIRFKIDGKTGFEWVLDQCAGAVSAQVDVGWALHAGEDPEALLWRNKDRVLSLHYKDFDKDNKEVTVGEGRLDMLACFQFGRAMGIPQLADMDTCDMARLETVMKRLQYLTPQRERTDSILAVIDTVTGEVTDLHRFHDRVIEAPNWLNDGDTIFYNADGRIWRYTISTDTEELVDTGGCVLCNNDHVPSLDNTHLAVSCDPGNSPWGYQSYIYDVDLATGTARQVTPEGPSFLHGWSPDGNELAYCAFRRADKGFRVDILTIPVEGGNETTLTDGVGYNDGPEYSPDGAYIYFNSTREGLMQVFRMDRDGGNLTRLTFTDENNWFGHISPDNKKLLSLAFRKGDLDPNEHLPNMQVSLNLLDADGANPRKLLTFFGGQGSINVNSWAPDSRRAAFVYYELKHR